MRRATLVASLPWLRWPIGRYRMHMAKMNYLYSSGWVRSLGTFLPEDANGQPLPWYTYPAIEFLDGRLRPDMSVFEFGAGNSTIWYASKVREVHSVEHNGAWAARVASSIPPTCHVEHRTIDRGYARAAVDSGKTFDVIVIDGAERIECAHTCLPALKKEGVIIWDDAERTNYAAGFDHLAGNGFRRIDFHGLAPMKATPKSTAVFYRTTNCFAI